MLKQPQLKYRSFAPIALPDRTRPDGRAEVIVELLYPNGGRSWISIGEEAMLRVVDGAGVTDLGELIGQPWTLLLHGMDIPGFAPDASSAASGSFTFGRHGARTKLTTPFAPVGTL